MKQLSEMRARWVSVLSVQWLRGGVAGGTGTVCDRAGGMALLSTVRTAVGTNYKW